MASIHELPFQEEDAAGGDKWANCETETKDCKEETEESGRRQAAIPSASPLRDEGGAHLRMLPKGRNVASGGIAYGRDADDL